MHATFLLCRRCQTSTSHGVMLTGHARSWVCMNCLRWGEEPVFQERKGTLVPAEWVEMTDGP